ncbi:MFS transporter [Arthrobacter sp. NtRootA1]|uniref:MFS transporter n=1 Tax=Micrococcaceae TaxID=1268 RepID=UPI001CC66C60|nr:MFS transporter [Arthrobacter sp. NtRootA1]BCW05803.1 MFS transporter [Arthrobacter sp. NtRootA1]
MKDQSESTSHVVPGSLPQSFTAEALAERPETRDSVGEAPAIPKVGAWFTTVFALTYFGFFLVLLMPTLFSLAYKVQLIDPGTKEATLGLIIGIGGFISLVTGPIFGVLSDATRTRWGRRRPYLIGGLALSLVSAVIIALASDVWVIIIGWIIAQLGAGSISAALNPTLAERVPDYQRGRLGSLSGVAASVAGVVATLAGSFLTSNLLLLFLAPVAVFAVAAALWLVTVPDAPAPKEARIGSLMDIFRHLAFNPKKHQDFAWVWVGKFALNIGFSFFSTYQFYFLLDRMGFTPETAGQQMATVGGLSLLGTLLFTLGGGYLSDRLRRRKPFIYLSSAMIAAGSIAIAISPDFLTYIIGGVVLSAGIGAFNSVDLALAADVVPKGNENGKWMGIYFLSGSLASTVGPVMAPLVLAVGGTGANYTALFIVGGLLSLGAAITAARVRGAR